MTPIRLKMPSLAQTQWPDTAWTRVMKNEMKQCDLRWMRSAIPAETIVEVVVAKLIWKMNIV